MKTYYMPVIDIKLNHVKEKAYKVGEHLCVTNDGVIHCLHNKQPLFPYLKFDSAKTASLVAAQIDTVFGTYLDIPDDYNHRMKLSMWTVEDGVKIWHWIDLMPKGSIVTLKQADNLLLEAERTYYQEYYRNIKQ